MVKFNMKKYTLRIEDEKLKALKHIATEENRSVRDILLELITDYIEAHKETLELLSIPGFYEKLIESSKKAKSGIKGKTLEELEG